MSKNESEAEATYIYTIPLSQAWAAPRHRRAKRAINIIREFAERHMKTSNVKISSELNELIWQRGIQKPPRRVNVKMEKDKDGLVTISLATS